VQLRRREETSVALRGAKRVKARLEGAHERRARRARVVGVDDDGGLREINRLLGDDVLHDAHELVVRRGVCDARAVRLPRRGEHLAARVDGLQSIVLHPWRSA
jgi:hypothetical protein